MTPEPSFLEIFAGLQAGDQDAAHRLYQRFVADVVKLAGQRLKYQLHSAADPESVAQSVFMSFFQGVQAGKLECANWGMLYGLLGHITFRKCFQRKRHESRQKRDPGVAVVSLEEWTAVANQPGPDEVAMFGELLDKALGEFDADERAVIDVYLQGAVPDAVARQTGFSTRTVYRILGDFRTRLERLLAEE